MFSGCNTLINVDLFDTSSVTHMDGMFYYCSSLTSIPHFNTSSVTNMGQMFKNCLKLTNIPLLDTSKAVYMDETFASCKSLVEIPKLDLSKTTTASATFIYNSSLTTLGGFTGLKVNLSLSESPLLTHDSLLNVINEAADVTASPKTLTLGATNLAKLTDEEKAIATSKGWTLK